MTGSIRQGGAMTETTTTQTLDPTDPRAHLAAAVRLGGTVIAAVRTDQLELPTPCDGFDVRTLLGHLTAVLLRVANVGRGGSVFDTPERVERVADDGWLDAWIDAAHDVQAVWSDASLLGATFELPWATLPGAGLLAMYTSEVTVHTWDLARATGQEPSWDDAVVLASLHLMEQILPPAQARARAYEEAAANMPEGRREFTPPFADAVEVPASAPAIDRLVAWTGRRP
jgi:uncharacterized protein (TIGR03086 family)